MSIPQCIFLEIPDTFGQIRFLISNSINSSEKKHCGKDVKMPYKKVLNINRLKDKEILSSYLEWQRISSLL